MAAKKSNPLDLTGETLIDVVGIKGDKIVVKTMTFAKAKAIKKTDWQLIFYQVGFHSFKNTN